MFPLRRSLTDHVLLSYVSVSITDECISAFNELRMGKGKVKYVIYKIANNKKEVVVDEIGHDHNYEVFRERLIAARDDKGNVAPRYAVYDVEFELGGGEGKRCVLSSHFLFPFYCG